jgi:hypothetical protein
VVSLLAASRTSAATTSTARFVELFESYREGDRVRAPRRYLMTLGRRR